MIRNLVVLSVKHSISVINVKLVLPNIIPENVLPVLNLVINVRLYRVRMLQLLLQSARNVVRVHSWIDMLSVRRHAELDTLAIKRLLLVQLAKRVTRPVPLSPLVLHAQRVTPNPRNPV